MTCFDRTRETADLWKQFDEGRNLLMLAPRRIGKTVLLNRLRDMAADRGIRAVILDVEGYREEKDFFRQCCAAIQEELSTGAKVMTALGDRFPASSKAARKARATGGNGCYKPTGANSPTICSPIWTTMLANRPG